MVHVLSGAVETDAGVIGVVGETMIDDSGRATHLTGEAEAIVVVLEPLRNANDDD